MAKYGVSSRGAALSQASTSSERSVFRTLATSNLWNVVLKSAEEVGDGNDRDSQKLVSRMIGTICDQLRTV